MTSTFTSPSYVNRVKESWQPGYGVTQSGGAGSPTLYFDFMTGVLNPAITFTRASTGTYFNSAGTLTSAAINAPRFDYNPATLAAQGLLIEEQRTNLLLQSEDFATTWTTNSSPTITTNTTTAPDGTTTADTITSTATASYVAQTVTFTGDGTKTFSIFIKAGTSGRSVVFLRDATAAISRGNATITWSGGVPSVAVVNGSLQYLQTCPNGWYRLAIIVDSVVAANSNQLRIQPDNLVGTGSLIVWGAQIENAAFSTSYIPTTTTALTRSADVASVNTLSPWYNATEGTLFAEFNIPSALTSGSGPRLFTLQGTGGAAVDEMPLFVVQATGKAVSFNAFTGGVNAGRMDASPAFVANTIIKAAATYATNARAVTAGGAVPTTSATVFTIPTITVARLGAQDAFGNSVLNGYLRRITYYPRKFSNAELQAITA